MYTPVMVIARNMSRKDKKVIWRFVLIGISISAGTHDAFRATKILRRAG